MNLYKEIGNEVILQTVVSIPFGTEMDECSNCSPSSCIIEAAMIWDICDLEYRVGRLCEGWCDITNQFLERVKVSESVICYRTDFLKSNNPLCGGMINENQNHPNFRVSEDSKGNS